MGQHHRQRTWQIAGVFDRFGQRALDLPDRICREIVCQ
jgi:hypothetical protein